MTPEMVWVGLQPLSADLVLTAGLLSVLTADVLMPPGAKRVLGWGALATLITAFVALIVLEPTGWSFGRSYHGDAFATFVKAVFYVGGALAVLAGLESSESRWPRRQGEYHLLILASTLGMSLLAGAKDVITLVVAFELMGVPLYVLAAWSRDDRRGTEGALKLLLSGGVSTAAILYGLGTLSGLASSTQLELMANHATMMPTPFAAIAAAIALAGVGFKLGVVPFHFWVPDTYEGSPSPAVVFLAVGPKIAGLVALVQVLLAGDDGLRLASWAPLVALATLSMLAGNLLALNQSNAKRLLAFSGVAHVGLMLLALAMGTQDAIASLLFYTVAYLFTNAGVFLVVHALGGDGSIASFDGLARRNAGLGMMMLVFLLSLGGIPFAVGFWAKLYLFLVAWGEGLGWFVVLAALVSVLGLFYYLRIARAMFMNPPADPTPVKVDTSTAIAIAVCVFGVVGVGLYPGPLVAAAEVAARAIVP
jgi:NADH-quinone oxidoreductase subunit N